MYDNLVLVTRTLVVRWLPDMRSVCVTVTEGARVVVSGRAIRVDDSATLSSVVALVVGDPLVVSRVDRVQASNTISGTRFDATVEDEVGLQLEFERRYFFFHLHTEMTSQQVERPAQRCASDNASRPQNLLEKYFTVLPICEACKAVKPPVVRLKKKEN